MSNNSSVSSRINHINDHDMIYSTTSKINHINDHDAVEQSDGSWLHNDGDVYWYNERGDTHREDGPAILRPDRPYIGSRKVDWFLYDQLYTFDEWLKLTPISDEEKMLLRLRYE